jgi:hypothetical protein
MDDNECELLAKMIRPDSLRLIKLEDASAPSDVKFVENALS